MKGQRSPASPGDHADRTRLVAVMSQCGIVTVMIKYFTTYTSLAQIA